MMIPIQAIAALLFLLIPSNADGQVVRGRVVDAGGQPAAGVVVLLEDSLGVTVRRSITGSDGGYEIRAPEAGSYSLRTLRLGYRPTHRPLPALMPGRETLLDLAVEPLPLQLARVVVRASRRCSRIADNTRAVELWWLIRTALEAQAVTAALANYTMTTRITDREMDVHGSPAGPPSVRRRAGPAVQPFVSTTPDSLATEGYVTSEHRPVNWRSIAARGSDGDLVFRGPDADVLLSDRFARDHCFELVASSDSAQAELGLAFTPAQPSRDVVDIRGVMWVDRYTSELRRITFSYDGIPEDLGGDLGGDLRYVALPAGGWVLSHWEIRMPVAKRVPFGVPDRGMGRMRNEWRLERTGTHVTHGEVLEVRRAGAPVWSQRMSRVKFRIVGVEPEAGSATRLRVGVLAAPGDERDQELAAANSPRVLRADSLGHYEVSGPSPDVELRVLVWNLAVDSLGIAPETLTVATRAVGDTSVISLRAPTMGHVLRRLCGTAARDTAARALVGVVRNETGERIPNVGVQASFVERPRQVATGRLVSRSVRKTAQADSAGRFLICAVPSELPITIIARHEDRESEPVVVRVPSRHAYTTAGIIMSALHGTVERP